MIDGIALAEWVRTQHIKGKHALIYVNNYEPSDVIEALFVEFPGAQRLGSLDLVVNELWISSRRLLDRIIPAMMKSTSTISVCIISPQQ